MSQTNGMSPRYKVRCSTQVAQLLKRLHQGAAEANRGSQFVTALQIINRRLKDNPIKFGEPLYRLSVMNLTVYNLAVLPLIVDFAVHEELLLVFLQNAHLLLPS